MAVVKGTSKKVVTAVKEEVKKVVSKVVAPEKKKVSQDEMFRLITEKAHAIYIQRGCAAGDSLDDWYKAEALVKKELGV